MNFDLNEDQLALRDSVRRLIVDRYDFERRRQRLLSGSGTDRQMWASFAEMGWLAILVPEARGGLGWSLLEAAIILQEFGRGLVAEPFLDVALLAVRILAATDAPAAGELLSEIGMGESLVAVALQEPGKRYAQDGLDAVAVAENGGFALSGRKILVTGGDGADHFIVSAMLDGALALLVVPADAQGVDRRAYRLLDGGWACDVTFANVPVGAGALIAAGDEAAEIIDRSLDEAAIGAGAEAIGCMDRIIEITVDYLRTRKQFGRPLAEFQVLQHRVADLFVETEMARSALYSALSAIDAPAEERQAAVSAARARIDQAGHRLGNQGIHLHGGMGMTMEYPVGHYYRRLVMLARAFGDTEYHLERYERLRLETV